MDNVSSDTGSVRQQRGETQRPPSRFRRPGQPRGSGPFPGGSIHPGLIPGISIEDTRQKHPTNISVFIVALLIMVAVVAWAAIAPDHLNMVGTAVRSFVVTQFDWFYGALVVSIFIFMFVVGYGPTGAIRLGADDSKPEFSTASWISMLFAAGLGIALIFYGPFEPLSHYLSPPPATEGAAGSMDAVQPAIAHTLLHHTIFAWAIYSLVGGALAYSSYRRGRLPLISAIFEPVFPDGSHRTLGKIIDTFAIMVTLFGTAVSLGIGALQIRTGTSLITGREISGNGFVVAAMVVLTIIFIISAVTGIKKGIRFLSNTNMALVMILATFVLIVGPTVYLLDLLPTSIYTFVGMLPDMFSVTASQGAAERDFVQVWTVLYWAWWISWSPFVGTFIAKISKGRTLKQFVTVVILVPSGISAIWYVIFGGTAIWMNQNDMDVGIEGAGENVMFDLMGNLPFAGVTTILVLIAIVIFFITAADSATNVMGSMSQFGRPIPSKRVTVIWGVALGMIAIALLLAGGQNALSGLQAIMVTTSLPFAIIVIGIMISWAKDLSRDPYMIRRQYAAEAISKGVQRGIGEHGDDFVFGVEEVESSEGAGADFDSDDPELTSWYTEAATEDHIEDPRAPHSDDVPGAALGAAFEDPEVRADKDGEQTT